MLYLGDFATGTTVYIPFDSFAASTGASSATSNFANTDIQIYKNGGTTQRSSAVGITVTTSFDSNTGLNMIAIDLSDNTDAGFYAAGNEYQVAVADITVDSQTVRFWAACFSIERVVKVNVTKWNGTAVSTPATAGIPDINVKNINNVAATSVTTINANIGTTQPINFTGTGASATAKSDLVNIAGSAVSASTAQLGVNVVNFGGSAGTFASGRPEVNTTHIAGSSVSTASAQIGVNIVNAAGTAWNSGAIGASTLAADTIAATKIATGAITNAKFAAGAIDAAAVAADAIGASELASDAVTEIAAGVWDRLTTSLTTAGSAGKLLVDNLNATVSSRATQTSVDTIDDFVDTEVAAILAAVDTEVAAIKTKTDSLTYTVANQLDVNVLSNAGSAITSAAGIQEVKVASIANNAITAASIATDAIGAAELAADAVTEIRSLASGTSDSGTTTTMVDAARTEADTDYWVGSLIVFTSGNIAGQARYITAFNAATDTITFAPAVTQSVSTQTYEIWPSGDYLRPTTSGRTLDVSSGGEAGVDWANIGSPTTSVNLSGTTVKTATDVETDTQDIQSRLPAALVSGRIDASVGAMAANVITATSINADAITATKIADGAIDAATFAAGAIDASAIAANAIGASELATDAVTEIAAGVWDRLTTDLSTANSAGKLLVDNLNATVSSRATQTSVDTIDDFVDTEVAAILAAVDTEVAAIKTKTDSLTYTVANQLDVNVLSNAGTAITAASGVQEVKVASIANNAITASSIAGDAITAAKIADGAIDAATFAAGAIDATAIAANAIGASELASDAVAEISSAVWSETTRLLTAGTNIVLAKGTGITGFNDLSAAAVNAEVDTALADYDGPTHTELISEINDVQTDIAALPTAAENATELLDQSAGVETGLTVRQHYRLAAAALYGKSSASMGVRVYRDTGDTTDRIEATVSNGDRSAVTLDPA